MKSGKGGKGGTVKSREQAIAIGLSGPRKKGKEVPNKKPASWQRGDFFHRSSAPKPERASC
jgi:hypothetical protein